MSGASKSSHPRDAGHAARQFFVVQELLGSPELARFYTDLLINSPTTIVAVRDRQNLSKSTAYKYANTLAELSIAEEQGEYQDGSALWSAEPVSGVWSGETTIEFSPVLIAVYGATSVDDDLDLFVDRHGKAALAPAVAATVSYLQGETTRHGAGDDLDLPAVEAIAVTQAIERIISVVKPYDSTLEDVDFEVEIHDRAIEQAPYLRANE